MELTVTYYCQNVDCSGSGEEQVETIIIRRGQTKTLKCGYCDEVAVELQANKKELSR